MSKQFKSSLDYVTSELNQPYSDNSQHSSNDQLSCYPITESDNSERSLVNKDESNNQPSSYLISGKADENKERHFQNFIHSSFEQPSSHPTDEILNGSSSMGNKEKYFQYSPLSSRNQLISFPMTESDNGEISPIPKSIHLYNSMLSYCDQPSSYPISKNANGSKEAHFQNFTHSSIEQPSSYPISKNGNESKETNFQNFTHSSIEQPSEIANGSIDVKNKEKYFKSSAASPSNQFISFPIAKSGNSEISSIRESVYLHNSVPSYDYQPASYPISKSAKGSKEIHFQNFIHSSVEKPNNFPISEITTDSSYTENGDKSFQRSLHSSNNQLISFPITESDNSERIPLLKSMDHDDSVFLPIDQPCIYPIKANSNVNKYSGSSGMHFDDLTLSSVDQPSSYPISESANGHSTDSGVGREQKNTDDTGKGRSVGKAKIDSAHESVCTSPSVIGGEKIATALVEPEIIIKSKPVEILVSKKLRGTFPAKLKISEMSLKQRAYRPRSISLGSADIPVTEKTQEKFSSLPNFRNEDRETNGKCKDDFNKIRKSSQEETFVRLSGSWPQEFADLEHKLSDPQLISALRTWHKESHHKIRLLHLFTATVKNLLLEYFENFSTKEDTPQALIIQLQNCLSYYHKEVDDLRIQVREAKTELEENHFRNAARYQSISEEHKIRLSQVIQDHEQQLSAAMDRALNARRQAASLQVQLTSALARNQQLEESNQQATQSSVTDNENMLDNFKKERAALKFMVSDLEENLAKCRKEVKHLEEHNSSLQNQTHNGSVLEKDYMNQLERQLSSERALISTLKTELQQERNRNQHLWSETKKHVQKSAVLQARLEAAYCEVVHKNKLLETLKEEILQKITKAFPDVLTSLPQLTDSSTSVANWVTSMKQAISNKENEIQKISKELTHLEKNVFDLSTTLKEKETVASTLTDEIQLTESKIISKNEELQLKREHVNKIAVYIKNTEEAILSLQQKAVEKEQMLQVLKDELKKKDDKLTKTASKVKIERDRFREILSHVKTSEEELKVQSGKLKQMKVEKENLKGQCLLKANDIEYLTKVLESKKKIINEMEKDIMASNDIIKGLIQNSDNLGFLPNWQSRINPNITQIKHTPFTSETEYKALDDKTVINSLRENIEVKTPEHLSDGMNFGQKKEHKSFSSKKKRPKTLPVKMTSVIQGSPFSKFEIGSSIKVKSPSDAGSVYYTQNTDIGSFNPKETSDASSTPTPLKLKQHTDVKVISTPLTNAQALVLQHTSKRPSKAKKKLTYSDGKLEKISTEKSLTYEKPQGISLEPNSDIPIIISGNLANSDYNLASSHSMKKTMILHNAEGRASPVMVNVNIQPHPLLVTDSGEHFICDVAMDVYPLQKLHEHQQSKTTSSSANREMQHGFNLEGTSETFILSDKECHTASSNEVKDGSNSTENYKLQSQNHVKSLKTPENLQMLQSSGTFTVLTSKDDFSEEPDVSGNEFIQRRHTVPILKNVEETNIISAQASTQTPPFAFSTAPSKSLYCSRDQSAVGKIFAYPSDIMQQQRHTNLPHTLTDSLCENTKDQVPEHDKLNHHLSQVKTPVTYKDFKHHHGLFWNKTFSPEVCPYPKTTWRTEKHGFPMDNTNYDNISVSHNSLPDSQLVGTSTTVLSFQPTPHKDGYIKYSSPCHITRQVPESNIRLPLEGEESELYEIQ